MKNKGLDLQSACDYVGTYSAQLMNDYMSATTAMASRSQDGTAAIMRFFEGASHWIRGNLEYVVDFSPSAFPDLLLNAAGALKPIGILGLTITRSRRHV